MWVDLIRWNVGIAGIAALVVSAFMALELRQALAEKKCIDVISAGGSFHADDLAKTWVKGKRRFALLLRLHAKRKKDFNKQNTGK
tara:strand:+ start:115 stop:369 length:255 start_codon:yes stop_codon:yes gene_type:complete